MGRRRDLTVLWLLEAEPGPTPVYWTRGVLALDRQPFRVQRQALDALLAQRCTDEPQRRGETLLQRGSPRTPSRSWSYAVRRCAIDATGLGAMLAEELQAQWGARVEAVQFTQAVKEELAVRVKRLLEDGRLRIPSDPVIRAALGSVKRFVTATGAVRFHAERSEQAGHADHFWALALALAAAEEPAISLDYVSTSLLRPFAQAAAF